MINVKIKHYKAIISHLGRELTLHKKKTQDLTKYIRFCAENIPVTSFLVLYEIFKDQNSTPFTLLIIIHTFCSKGDFVIVVQKVSQLIRILANHEVVDRLFSAF